MKMLGSSKVSGKLRITIPKDAADVMGVKDGDHILFYVDDKGNFQIRKG
jgi:AbrB family looped-hinge helix DNA binding protein